jgi:hypothetical protein
MQTDGISDAEPVRMNIGESGQLSLPRFAHFIPVCVSGSGLGIVSLIVFNASA